jgi:hypothetical protein
MLCVALAACGGGTRAVGNDSYLDASVPGTDGSVSVDGTADRGFETGSQADDSAADGDSDPEGGLGIARDGGSALATVTIDPTADAGIIPDTFLGISCEWSSVPNYLGDGAGNANAAALQLLANFAVEGNHPTLRIGGNSADESWWNPNAVTPAPAGVTVDITAVHVATLAAINKALGTALIPDLDLVLEGQYADAESNAAGLVQALLAAVPAGAIRAFEVGNEPDLWAEHALRPATYVFSDWKTDYDDMTAGIGALVSPSPPYAAPALSGTSWLTDLDGLYAQEGANLGLATAHRYPYNVCNGKAAPAPQDLLSAVATTQYATEFGPHVAAARAAGVDFRVAELNSVACGGASGVSNVYAAALWSADVAFELASIGAVGLNFHTPGSYYAVYETASDGTLSSVLPLYYGMRFYSLAVPSGSVLVTASVQTTAIVHAWATLGTDGSVRVALISLDPANGVAVRLAVPGATQASLIRMHAPSLEALSGITLGGQTWDGSDDGNPLGIAATEAPTVQGETMSVSLPSLDAVVVTVAR